MKAFAKNRDELAKRIAAYLKAVIARAGLTYADLAKRLKRHGYPDESVNSIKQKLHRGTFTAGFFLAALAALGVASVSLKDV